MLSALFDAWRLNAADWSNSRWSICYQHVKPYKRLTLSWRSTLWTCLLIRVSLPNFLEFLVYLFNNIWNFQIWRSFHYFANGREVCSCQFAGSLKFVLSSADSAFSPAYSKQFKELGGEGKLMEFPDHLRLRRAILAPVAGDGLLHLLPFISSVAEKTVMSWANRAVVITHKEMRDVVPLSLLVSKCWKLCDVNMPFLLCERACCALVLAKVSSDGFKIIKGISAVQRGTYIASVHLQQIFYDDKYYI